MAAAGTPSQGSDEAGEGVEPHTEGREDPEDRQQDLHGYVGDRPPSCPVPQHRLKPTQEPRAWHERIGVVDLFVEKPSCLLALEPTNSSRATKREANDGQPEEGDGEDHARGHGERDKGKANSR